MEPWSQNETLISVFFLSSTTVFVIKRKTFTINITFINLNWLWANVNKHGTGRRLQLSCCLFVFTSTFKSGLWLMFPYFLFLMLSLPSLTFLKLSDNDSRVISWLWSGITNCLFVCPTVFLVTRCQHELVSPSVIRRCLITNHPMAFFHPSCVFLPYETWSRYGNVKA